MIINILGNTTWGITLAKVLSNGNNQVNLIYRDKEKLSAEDQKKASTSQRPRRKHNRARRDSRLLLKAPYQGE